MFFSRGISIEKLFFSKNKLRFLTFFSVVVLTGGCAEKLETNLETNRLVKTTGEFTKDANGFKKNLGKKKNTIVGFTKLGPVTDSDFLSLERFEEPSLKIVKRVEQKIAFGEREENLLLAQEKLLIFAGEGFDTKLFGKNSDGNLIINYHYHITSPPKNFLTPRVKDFIDLESDNWNDSHDLIFHLPTTLFNKTEFLGTEFSVTKNLPAKTTLRSIEPIPKTQVLLRGSPESMLILRTDASSIDLLTKEESLNWKRYYGRR
tara:strand:- start:2850 stop:3632 length:783 start_codon:yes stop_codon:yes gene_type:complete